MGNRSREKLALARAYHLPNRVSAKPRWAGCLTRRCSGPAAPAAELIRQTDSSDAEMSYLREFTAGIVALPPYGVGALLVLLLYAIQAEIRFGAKARSHATGVSDRRSTLVVSLASAVPVVGFVLAMKGRMLAPLPGTLLLHEGHAIERGGPYRFVRHPGYLGSLLCLNGLALASGDALVLLASIGATFAAYNYRIRVEDAMLVAAFGEPYQRYRRETGALLPLWRAHGKSV